MELLKQKIQIGEIVKNRTLKYLVPSLAVYGETFKIKIKSLPILAFGIGDEDLKDLTLIQGVNKKLIFILYDSSLKYRMTSTIIDWFKNQDFFVEDVPYKDISSPLRLLIINFPEFMEDAYDKFLKGKYSKMYSKEEIKKFFNPNSHSQALNVINKTEVGATEHIKRILEDFDVRLTKQDLKVEGYEYDYPFSPQEEIFNHK